MATWVMGLLGLTLMLIVISWFLVPLLWARLLLMAGRHRAGLSPAWIDVDGCRWHYLHGGSGPVLVALHGFGADGDNWLRVAPALTQYFRLIAPDLPGFGQSVPGANLDFDIDSQVQRLHKFLRSIEASPYVIAGNSMGGWIAAAYAARYPGELNALWLLAPLGVHDSRESPMLQSINLNKNSPFQVANLAQFRKRVLNPMFGKQPWFPYPLQIYFSRNAQRLSSAAPSMFKQVLHQSPPLESISENINIPVLLQWGKKDQVVDVSGVNTLQSVIPEITVQLQDRTGHLPMLEAPDASVRFFTDFCKQHNLI